MTWLLGLLICIVGGALLLAVFGAVIAADRRYDDAPCTSPDDPRWLDELGARLGAPPRDGGA